MNDEIDPKLKARLDELKDVPARDPQAAARGRARFLAEAASRFTPVSVPVKGRHREWKLFTGKEHLVVMKAVFAAVIALTLLIGGTATVYAAQDDLPNEPLYGLKLFTENARLWANSDPEREVELLMQFVQVRIQEMNAMAMAGETPPATVEQRLEQQIQQALQVAAGMDNDAMQGALERIRATLQEQKRLMTQTQAQAQTGEEASRVMLRTRETIESRLRLVDEGTADPEGFRNTIRAEQELHTGQTATPPGQQGNGPGPNTEMPPTDDTDGNGNGSGGSGEGSGDGGDDSGSGGNGMPGTPTPGAGNGTPNPVRTPDPHGSGSGSGNKP